MFWQQTWAWQSHSQSFSSEVAWVNARPPKLPKVHFGNNDDMSRICRFHIRHPRIVYNEWVIYLHISTHSDNLVKYPSGIQKLLEGHWFVSRLHKSNTDRRYAEISLKKRRQDLSRQVKHYVWGKNSPTVADVSLSIFMTLKSRIFMLKMNSEKRNNTHVVMPTVCPKPEWCFKLSLSLVPVTLGTLRNHDGDCNGKVQKQ